MNPSQPSLPTSPATSTSPAANSTTPPPIATQPSATAAPAPFSHWPHALKYAIWSIVGVFAFVALINGVLWVNYRLHHSITEDAFVEAHIVNVAPEMVSGRIVSFLVEENDQVSQGQILAEVEPVHYRDQVEQARGKLELAEAEVKRQVAGLVKLKKDVPLQIEVAKQALAVTQIEEARAIEAVTLTTNDVNRTIEEGQAAVEVAKANTLLAIQEFERWTALAAQDATTKRKAQEVTRAHEAAKAEERLAEVRHAKAKANRTRIEVSQRDLEVARAMVAKAKIALELAETGYDQIHEVELMVDVKKEMAKDAQIGLESAEHQLKFTQIRAPFPGVVVKRYRSLGDFVSAGVPILSMYDPDLLYVTANLEETRLRGVLPGSLVELRLDAFDRPFQGRVVWINKSTGAQFALMPRNVVAGEFTKVVQRVPVRIWIEQGQRKEFLRAGLSAKVMIAHGGGDVAWAEQTAKEMAQIEFRYNQHK